MKFKKTIPAVLCLIALITVFSQASDKVDLKLRLKPGESHEMKMVQTQHINQTMMGQVQEMNQVQEIVMDIDCLNVDANGNMDIEMIYKSMKITMDGPMGHMEFDSQHPKPADPNKPQEQMLDTLFSAIAGGKFQMKTAPTGRTTNFRGLKEMLTNIKTKLGSNAAAPGMEFVDKMFDEKQIKELTGTMFAAFPPEPIAVGDSWYDTMSMNFIVPIDVDTTYMLKQSKNGIAYIDKVAKIDMGDSSKPLEIDPNNKLSMQLSGTMNASDEVDENNGLTHKSNITMDFSGVMKMSGNPQMPEGMTIPMKIKGNVVVEIVK